MYTLLKLGILPIAGLAAAGFTSANPSNTCTRGSPQAHIQIEQKRSHHRKLQQFENFTIRHIEIINKGIFDLTDPDENYWIYRVANKIQTKTRENVIRQQLLFSEGDKFDLSNIMESIRLLRSREYILEVDMAIISTCDSALDLLVIIQDAWVIEVNLSYGRQGGEDSSGFGIRNGNFLGTGNDIAVAYETDIERNKVIYHYQNAMLFGRQLELDIYHADLSDGSDQKFSLTKPFYSFNTRWSYNIATSRTTTDYKTRFNDNVLNEFEQTESVDTAHVGHAFSINQERAYRFRVGVTREYREFSETDETNSVPDTQLEEYTWIELERATNLYEQYSNLNYIGRKQDIEVGTNFTLRLGFGHDMNELPIEKLIVAYDKIISYDEHHLLQFGAYSDLMHIANDERWRNSFIGLHTSYYYFINGKNRWYLNILYNAGRNLPEYRQFTLGEIDGMRGYPLAYQRGDKRYVATIERRFYSDAHWFNLIRVGAVAFIDIGHAWGAEEYHDESHLASAGFGFRLHSSKTGSPLVMHLNLAAPLVKDPGMDDYLISFSMENRF